MGARDFVVWFGGFADADVSRLVTEGLTMADFARMRPTKDAMRFAARDEFVAAVSGRRGLQKIIQSSAFVEIKDAAFYATFEELESAKSIEQANECVNRLLNDQSDAEVK